MKWCIHNAIKQLVNIDPVEVYRTGGENFLSKAVSDVSLYHRTRSEMAKDGSLV